MSNEELLAAFSIVGADPWMFPSIWGSSDDLEGGRRSLARRRLASKRGLVKEMRDLITILSHPKSLVDIFTFHFSEISSKGIGFARRSFVNSEAGTYSLIINRDGIVARREDIRTLIEELSEGTSGIDGLPESVVLNAKELTVLLLILTMDIYGGDVPGLSPFTSSDVGARVSVGMHVPIMAQIRLYGETEAPDLREEEVYGILLSLAGKGILVRLGEDSFSVSEDFLPVALAVGSPDRVDVISAVKEPDSELPDVRTAVLFRFGRAAVVMSILDEGSGVVEITPIRGERHLRRILENLLLESIDLEVEARALELALAELVESGELTEEEYEEIARLVNGTEASSTSGEGVRPCPKCGHLNRPDAKFCVKCGAPLT